ncbi:TIR domain-containing protein [Streptomyces sp. NPDC058572]|uniref:tetratricopeptide repeat protein n=1 Tax=Streptomyces sp. NPDC058572 TaxID=3346546 RepID=UPI00364B1716
MFVSHAGADRAWAEWVAWQLVDAGYEVELDHWDWGAGDNFVVKMNTALASGRMLAVFSAAYFDPDRFTTDEWTAVVAAKQKLIPVRVDSATAPPVLRPLIAPSLAGLGEDEARTVLLKAVGGPRRPDGRPGFPGDAGRLRGMGGSGPRLPGSLPRVWNLPGRNAGFTGRDDLLVHLRQALASGSRVAVQALRGRGGVGKTQLAIEYGHRFAGEYELAWWIRCEEPALIPDQLAQLAVKTGAAQADTPPAQALEALTEELRSRGRWLLVFDNAEDPAALAPYLPGGNGHVLITSRNPHWQDTAIAVEVDGFARTESIALLRSRVPGLGEEDAGRLAHELEDLPLALVQAAALLADGLTLPQYLNLLQKRISEVLDEGRPPRISGVAGRPDPPQHPAPGHHPTRCSRLAAGLRPAGTRTLPPAHLHPLRRRRTAGCVRAAEQPPRGPQSPARPCPAGLGTGPGRHGAAAPTHPDDRPRPAHPGRTHRRRPGRRDPPVRRLPR